MGESRLDILNARFFGSFPFGQRLANSFSKRVEFFTDLTALRINRIDLGASVFIQLLPAASIAVLVRVTL
ncbi:hypothetical protein HGG75_10925 [Ochrobactrum pseudogrignonense]|nr:hypothetical protein [Brucella pseudogrignonensis]